MSDITKAGVLCVDDNLHVADAVRLRLAREESLEWKGWVTNAGNLVDVVQREHPAVVLLDLDLPGRDPFSALAELAERCPEARVVVFSGLVQSELIDRAFDSGAWGYVSKNDGDNELVSAIRSVRDGNVALSSEVAALYYGR